MIFAFYDEIPRGQRLAYKRALAVQLSLPITTVNNWFTYKRAPERYHEKVQKFNETYKYENQTENT